MTNFIAREDLGIADPVLGTWPLINLDKVKSAFNKNKSDKVAGASELAAEMQKASEDIGVKLATGLINAVISECLVSDDWLKSIIVNVCKGKGDALERGHYWGIKPFDQDLKVMERVLEGFIKDRDGPDRGTTDAIFIITKMQEKYTYS